MVTFKIYFMKRIFLLLLILFCANILIAQTIAEVKIRYIQKKKFQVLDITIKNNTNDTIWIPWSRNRRNSIENEYACFNIDRANFLDCYKIDPVIIHSIIILSPKEKFRRREKLKLKNDHIYTERVFIPSKSKGEKYSIELIKFDDGKKLKSKKLPIKFKVIPITKMKE